MLLAVVPADQAEEARAALAKKNISSGIIGHFEGTANSEGLDMHEELWEILARKEL